LTIISLDTKLINMGRQKHMKFELNRIPTYLTFTDPQVK